MNNTAGRRRMGETGLSPRARLTLDVLRRLWAGRPPPWVRKLATVPVALPGALAKPAAAAARHPLAHRRLDARSVGDGAPPRQVGRLPAPSLQSFRASGLTLTLTLALPPVALTLSPGPEP